MLIKLDEASNVTLPLPAESSWLLTEIEKDLWLLDSANKQRHKSNPRNIALGATIKQGVVGLDYRPEEAQVNLNGSFLSNQLSFLRFFEWHMKISFLQQNCVQVQLSACPICNGVDPKDSNAIFPEFRKEYLEKAGHKPNCKLAIQIALLEKMLAPSSLACKESMNAVHFTTHNTLQDRDSE